MFRLNHYKNRQRIVKSVAIVLSISIINFFLFWILVDYFTARSSFGDSYHVVAEWPKLPEGFVMGQVSGVDVDSHNNVFVFHRAERIWEDQNLPLEPIMSPTVLVFDNDTGKLKQQWGANKFIMPHSLTIDSNDNIWLTDVGQNKVFKFDHKGNFIFSLGAPKQSDNSAVHFNLPTDVAVKPDGSFYVSDGYGNSRILKFSPEGHLLTEWGTRGNVPGQFLVPHSLALDKQGYLYVADRGNSRLQIFDKNGKFVDEWKSKQIGRPWAVRIGTNGDIYIVDGGEQHNFFSKRARIVKLDRYGNLLASFGSYGKKLGQFIWPHAIAVKGNDTLYVGEVGAGMRIQKFIRN